MNRFAPWLSAVLGVLATIATVVMMLAIVIDVAARGITGASIPGLFELGETVLVAAVFLGMAYTGVTNGHIAVDLLTERLTPAVSRIVVLIAWILTAITLAWFTYATAVRAMASSRSNETRMGLVNWPVWPARWIIVIGLAAMLLVAIVNILRVATKQEILGFQDAAIDSFDPLQSGIAAANDPQVAIRRQPPTTGEGEHNG